LSTDHFDPHIGRSSLALRAVPQPARRKIERPPYQQPIADVASMSFMPVARKYGVSGNAIRKWIRGYEHERGG
jgi:hypothetical protein